MRVQAEIHGAAVPEFVERRDHGIHVVDTGFHRPRFDAAYLIVEQGRAAFVDAGTNHSVPRLLAALDAAGLAPEAVDLVIATHVHLDHAGAWACSCGICRAPDSWSIRAAPAT